MRHNLANVKAGRHVYTATVKEFSYLRSRTFSGKTVLLINIRNSKGDPLTDHVWISASEFEDGPSPHVGDRIKFNARIRKYKKSGGETDYKFSSMQVEEVYEFDDDIPEEERYRYNLTVYDWMFQTEEIEDS